MKIKYLIATLLALMVVGVPTTFAQTDDEAALLNSKTQQKQPKRRVVGALEVEVAGGIVSPTDKLQFDKNKLGWNAQAEIRYNLKSLPLDVGVHVDGALFNRQGQRIDTVDGLKEIVHANAKFTSITGLGVVDLNIGRSKGISLFVGCGIGYGMLINDFSNIKTAKDIDRLGCFCVMPRVGVELFHLVRATLYFKSLKKEQNHFGASVGFVFGGRRK